MSSSPALEGEPPEAPFPLKEFLGFTIEKGEGRASAWLDLGEHHLNPYGTCHGAVPFALMDTAMGAAVSSLLDEGSFCATIEMQTRFLRAVTTGRMTAEATVVHPGRRIVHLEAQTVDAEGRLVATATSSFAVIAGS
jgi:acyl-CoA thioesterase